MSSIYGVISDSHNHNWSAFSHTNSGGVNNRLQFILDDTIRCAQEVKAAGGQDVIHCGDLFHVRGSVAPTVLNPTLDCYRHIIEDLGVSIHILAGNHDLERKNSERVSSAITALEDVGCTIVNDTVDGLRIPHYLNAVMVPWHESVVELKATLEELAKHHAGKDLLIHAPVNGVILGIPDHGLDGTYLASLGFKRVFSGHYHNHKEVAPGVFSVGAIAHHTWSDVGTKAGFLIVTDTEVKWRSSNAPRFIEINEDTDPHDIPLIVDGNYVRATLAVTNESEVAEFKETLTNFGALGVLCQWQKKASVTARTNSTVKAGASIEHSINEFIAAKAYPDTTKLFSVCESILTEARTITQEA